MKQFLLTHPPGERYQVDFEAGGRVAVIGVRVNARSACVLAMEAYRYSGSPALMKAYPGETTRGNSGQIGHVSLVLLLRAV